MRTLGIDPGTHRIGWGIIEGDISEQVAIAYGCIEFKPHTSSPVYLKTLRNELNKIITEHKPVQAGVEKIFFQKNKKTAMEVAQARGVILLTLSENNIPYQELAPNTIKSTVTGSGRAHKKQMQDMVENLLNLKTSTKLDDTSDALATAITALTYSKIEAWT